MKLKLNLYFAAITGKSRLFKSWGKYLEIKKKTYGLFIDLKLRSSTRFLYIKNKKNPSIFTNITNNPIKIYKTQQTFQITIFSDLLRNARQCLIK